jgi:FkbM family methyltransferase
MGRSIYIDFGANTGDTIAAHMAASAVDFCWGFEPNPHLADHARRRFEGQPVQIIEMAAWISEGVLPLYLGHPLSSTLLPGKVALEYYPEYAITYENSVDVRTFDTARWLREHVRDEDEVIVKMDIEGAEYQVLRHLLDSGDLHLIDELRCEFHVGRFPAFEEVHHRLVREVASHTRLVDWH